MGTIVEKRSLNISCAFPRSLPYIAEGTLFPLVALAQKLAKPPESEASWYSSSCAGLQLDFPAQQNQEVTEVWVPFEEEIAIGWE